MIEDHFFEDHRPYCCPVFAEGKNGIDSMVLTVSKLNEYAGNILAKDPLLRNLKVEGELTGFKRHSSGHLYFSLKDDKASVRCVMFRQSAMELAFAPRDGMHVAVDGYAALYARDGQFQLYVKAIAQQGEGYLHMRFLMLKEQLLEEGYFDEGRKRSIPFLPKCVGIVTSRTGAALQDILQIISRRFPKMNIELCSARVQGVGAAESIANAISRLNARKRADVLIVGRGGGSLEDLWAFNERIVADAIRNSAIPVISAVGHETDFTIADFAADLRAPTPSAAAELCVPEYAALMQRVDELYTLRLRRAFMNTLSRKRDMLRLIQKARGFSAVKHSIALKKQILAGRLHRLNGLAARTLHNRRESLGALLKRLERASFGLERGMALITDASGMRIRSIKELDIGMPVKIRMADGSAGAVIRETEKYGNTKEL